VVDRGQASSAMQNQHGVVIRMRSTTKGAEVNASVEAVSVKLDGGPQ